MNEKTATEIRRIGVLEVLKSGLEKGLIAQTEFDEHQRLASSLSSSEQDYADHPELAHKRMVEILEKSYGGEVHKV